MTLNDGSRRIIPSIKKNCAKNLSYNTPIFPNPFILTTDASGVAIGDPITRRNK